MELEPGVEGLVHVSEMSWVKKNLAPSKLVTPGTEVDVQVLEVDSNKRRICLGLKQTQENPWTGFTAAIRSAAPSKARSSRSPSSACSSASTSEIDGMVHLSDLSWTEPGEEAIKDYEKGQMVKAKVLDIDVEKERVSLGIKQLGNDPIEKAGAAGGALRKNQVVTGTVTEVNDGGIEVELADGVKRLHPPRRSGPRPQRPAPGTLRQGRQGRRPGHQRRQGQPQGLALHQGARNLGREGSRGAVRLLGLGRVAGRHPGRGAQEEDEEGRVASRQALLRIGARE